MLSPLWALWFARPGYDKRSDAAFARPIRSARTLEGGSGEAVSLSAGYGSHAGRPRSPRKQWNPPGRRPSYPALRPGVAR